MNRLAGWPIDRPGHGNDRTAVSIAGGTDRCRVEQSPFLARGPPPAVTILTAQFLPRGPAMFAPQPSPDRLPHVVAQVGEGHRRRAGPEVGAPAAQSRIESAE